MSDIQLSYYYGSEDDQFTFYRIPKLLMKGEQFKDVTIEAKVLYGLLLDRMSLSIRNKWLDEENRVYIIYTYIEIMEDLGCAEQKASKLLSELERFGLVERKRRGLGKPNIIYVKNLVLKTQPESQFKNCENHRLIKLI